MCNRFENSEGIEIYRKLDEKVWNELKDAYEKKNSYATDIQVNSIVPVLDYKDGYNLTERVWSMYFEGDVDKFTKKLTNRFNLQTETLQKPYRKDSKAIFENCRAVVGATAYMEYYKPAKGVNIPIRITIPDYPQFFFPCFTKDEVVEDGQVIKYFTFLTITPNKFQAEFHSRMPVILTPERAKAFLHDKPENAMSYCVPFDDSIPMFKEINFNITSQVAKKWLAKNQGFDVK